MELPATATDPAMPKEGGAWVQYSYCISIIVLTFTLRTNPVFVPRHASRVVRGLPYCLISLLFGWWGFPWGIIRTPISLMENLVGGRVIDERVHAEPVATIKSVAKCIGCGSNRTTQVLGRVRCNECGLRAA